MTVLESLIYDFIYRKQKTYKERFTSLEGLDKYLKYFNLEPTQKKIDKALNNLIKKNYIIKQNKKYSINRIFGSLIEIEPTKLYITGFKSVVTNKRTNEEEELKKFLRRLEPTRGGSNSKVYSIRIPEYLLKELNEISNKTNQSKNALIIRAIEEFLSRNNI